MRLAPGVPLKAALAFDAAKPAMPAARLAMADPVAQMEWEAPVIAARLPVSPLL
ncbi:hypothetical protein JKL49_07560 [Phenylobacterium sp. 20VBR1]|uniref:Uncharacterized protein n=1 Tax=Phenylobacterium glaciei TaxID=2803784 RepID=A0A941D0L6_9CAUL|nr:hypothetical protein [Phenylobacterium glaciei]MBR7619244.1 hypothetical protein [Phenylobacterium glaciei]